MSTATAERPAQVHFPQVERAASVIVREWPEEKTCYGSYRLPDGSMCALGILADAKNYPWEPYMRGIPGTLLPGRFITEKWGFTLDEMNAVREAHDLKSKDAAADLLAVYEVKHAAR